MWEGLQAAVLLLALGVVAWAVPLASEETFEPASEEVFEADSEEGFEPDSEEGFEPDSEEEFEPAGHLASDGGIGPVPTDPATFYINLGFSGIVIPEWRSEPTQGFKDPPKIVHPNLNGATEDTTITGKHMTTVKDRPIFAFKGIKFGAPALAERRFKRTEPAGVYWEGNELNACRFGSRCPQMNFMTKKATGDEDCLYINVYTPYLPEDLPEDRQLPVMMFLHGGGLLLGDSYIYRPTYLLDRDVILVVPHYRLGNLGYFSLDNDDAPGNAGMWDQIEALKWIQDNIEGFGGDKNRVTIFGEGSGSASVNWLLLLPQTEGLMHGAIGESGTALDHWAYNQDPLGSAKVVGEFLGCENWENPDLLYVCMRDMDVANMTQKMDLFFKSETQQGNVVFRGASPVLQGRGMAADSRLITKAPLDYFNDGDVKDIPLIVGANKHEGSFVLGLLYLFYLLPNNYTTDSYYVQYDMLGDMVSSFGLDDLSHDVSESLQDAYFNNLNITDFTSSTTGLIDMLGVFYMKAGAWRTAKLHADHSKDNTFFYSFDFESKNTMFNLIFRDQDPMPFTPGVTVGDDLFHLFHLFNLDEPQLLTKDRLVRMWTNLAIYGDPTPSEDQKELDRLELPQWTPLNRGEHSYLLIQEEATVEQEYPERWHIAQREDGLTLLH